MKIMEKVLLSLAAVLLVSCGASGIPADNNGDGPSVIEIHPMDGETGVSRDPVISVTFERSITCVSFDAAFSLKDPGGNEVFGTINCRNDVVTMTPHNQLQPGTTYLITISTALIDSDEVAINGSFNWSFTTTNKAWGSPVQIESHAPLTLVEMTSPISGVYFETYGQRPFPGEIDVNDNGTVGVAWRLPSFNGLFAELQFDDAMGFARFDPDTGWELAQTVSYAYSGRVSTSSPAVTVTSSDTLVAAWGYTEVLDGRFVLDSSQGNISDLRTLDPGAFDNGGFEPFGSSATSEAEPGHVILAYPAMVADSIDGLIGSSVLVRRYVDGVGWDAAHTKTVAEDVSGDIRFVNVRVASNSSGFATVTWIAGTNNLAETRLCYSHYSPGPKEWSPADCFANSVDVTFDQVELGMDELGNSVLVWAGAGEIYSSVHPYDSVLDWKDRTISTVGTVAFISFDRFKFAMNKSGQAVLAWMEHSGPDFFTLQASSYLPETDEWTDIVDLYSFTQGTGHLRRHSQLGDVTINDAGDALVVYMDDGGLIDLVAVPHNPQDGWATPQTIVSNGGYSNPRIALDNEGNATAVYIVGETFDTYVWASRYE